MRRAAALFSFLMLTLGLLVFSSGTVAANSAPPRWTGSKSGVLVPGSSAQVHVLGETLRFDVSDYLAQAQVTARYEMENRGTALSDYAVVFVFQDTSRRGGPGASVTWNGKPLAVESIDLSKQTDSQSAETRKAWTEMTTVIDPVTGERYSNQDFFGQSSLEFVQFHLNLGSGERGTLEVKYEHVAATDKNRHANILDHYQYLLLPAKGWASFGPIDIQVKAPDASKAYFASTLPMQREGDVYRTTLPGLPDENLAFSFMSREGIIGNMADPGPYYWMAFGLLVVAAFLLGWGMGWLSGLIPNFGGALAVGITSGIVLGAIIDVLLAFVFMALFPALHNQSYGLGFVAFGQILLAVPVTAVTSGIVAARKNRRKYGHRHVL